jgi:hypothetical protein
VAYAGAEFWDPFYRQRRESGHDLDWGGLWTGPFLVPLRGYSVTAIDLSGEAIGQAKAKFGPMAAFMVADMTKRLPFPDEGFDAVMSNVAMHMFPDGVTRAVFAEVRRGGLRWLRARRA